MLNDIDKLSLQNERNIRYCRALRSFIERNDKVSTSITVNRHLNWRGVKRLQINSRN